MNLELKTNKDFIEGFIQGSYMPTLKIKEVLEYIENLDIWKDDAILKEILENIERILKK